MDGQVCALEGCGSFYDAKPSTCKHVARLFFTATAKSTLPVTVRGVIYYGLQAAIFGASRLLEGLNDIGGDDL